MKKKYFNTRKIFFLVSASKWFLRSSKVKMKWILLASWIMFQFFRKKKDFIIIGKTFGNSGHFANRTRNAFESWTRGKFSQRWPQTQLRSVAYSSNFLAIIYNEAKFAMKYHSHAPSFLRQFFFIQYTGVPAFGTWKKSHYAKFVLHKSTQLVRILLISFKIHTNGDFTRRRPC